jgi:hypothetical protein
VTERPCSGGFTALIHHDGTTVSAFDCMGRLIAQAAAGADDASIIQQAVDSATGGGEIRLCAGRYRLNRSLVLSRPCTLSGEGRATVLVPPANDYAIRMVRLNHSPHMSEWVWGPERAIVPDGLYKMVAVRMYGIVVRSLAIIGDARGKGIYLKQMSECCLENLWIHMTYDGAALFLDDMVMESEFINIHCYGNGSEANREASLVINSQDGGDSSNNLHFDKVYILHTNYIGVEIGRSSRPAPPRLLFFKHCFFHGWLPLERTAPYELIRCDGCDLQRGVTLSDCRITNAGRDSPLIRLVRGSMRINGSIFGGGWGPIAIRADPGTRIGVSECTFHGTRNGRQALSATDAEVRFVNNVVDPDDGGQQSVVLVSPRAAVVSGNLFHRVEAESLQIKAGPGSDAIQVFGNVFMPPANSGKPGKT